MSACNRRWILKSRPSADIRPDNFELVEQPVPEPGEGEVVVRVAMLSCDPTQRTWLSPEDNYFPPVELGSSMRAVGAGEITASRHADYAVGNVVVGILSWEDYARFAPVGIQQLGKLPPGFPLEQALWALSPSGFAAYFGMLDVGRPKAGETVVVSGAAGATGSLAGQIAKLKGCRVIGIAGGREKCDWLTEVAGFDAAIDYKSEPIDDRLRRVCPDGVDVFFDNVGGALLDAVLDQLAVRGRAVICGAVAHYNDVEAPPGTKRQLNLWRKRIRIEGFLVLDYMSRQDELLDDVLKWLSEGRIVYRVDVQDGLENAPATLLRLFSGANQGKQLLRVHALGAR